MSLSKAKIQFETLPTNMMECVLKEWLGDSKLLRLFGNRDLLTIENNWRKRQNGDGEYLPYSLLCVIDCAEQCMNLSYANMTIFALCGALKSIQWIRKHGVQWNEETFKCAVLSRRLDVLEWLKSQGCPWNSWVCAYAAGNGDLQTLQWLREHGCPWNSSACSLAARNGDLQTLQWLREYGCPWDEETCLAAAQNGHVHIIQWAIAQESPCPISSSLFVSIYAAINGHFEVAHWIDINTLDSDNEFLET